jgi:hypothetical protein
MNAARGIDFANLFDGESLVPLAHVPGNENQFKVKYQLVRPR